jgi:phage-related protein
MFTFKNISSDDMKVVIEEEEHFIAKAPQRIETIEVEGRDGAIYNSLGYSNIERPIKVQMIDLSKQDYILSWLNGNGPFEYKGRVTTAYFYSQVTPIRNSIIKIADFSFIRSPFWYKANDIYELVTSTILNEGNIVSRPIIRLEKQSETSIEVTIGAIRFKYNFNNDNYVEIDCEEMSAIMDGLLRNRQLEIGYDFPLLEPGINNVIIHSGDPIIKVKRKDRWL